VHFHPKTSEYDLVGKQGIMEIRKEGMEYRSYWIGLDLKAKGSELVTRKDTVTPRAETMSRQTQRWDRCSHSQECEATRK
jgi:hypothetical protein